LLDSTKVYQKHLATRLATLQNDVLWLDITVNNLQEPLLPVAVSRKQGKAAPHVTV